MRASRNDFFPSEPSASPGTCEERTEHWVLFQNQFLRLPPPSFVARVLFIIYHHAGPCRLVASRQPAVRLAASASAAAAEPAAHEPAGCHLGAAQSAHVAAAQAATVEAARIVQAANASSASASDGAAASAAAAGLLFAVAGSAAGARAHRGMGLQTRRLNTAKPAQRPRGRRRGQGRTWRRRRAERYSRGDGGAAAALAAARRHAGRRWQLLGAAVTKGPPA